MCKGNLKFGGGGPKRLLFPFEPRISGIVKD